MHLRLLEVARHQTAAPYDGERSVSFRLFRVASIERLESTLKRRSSLDVRVSPVATRRIEQCSALFEVARAEAVVCAVDERDLPDGARDTPREPSEHGTSENQWRCKHQRVTGHDGSHTGDRE
jgi:hypothetical protein